MMKKNRNTIKSKKEEDRLLFGKKPDRILFDHLPKCGGTTIFWYLRDHYPANRIFDTRFTYPETIKEFKSYPEYIRFGFRLITGHHTFELLNYVHPETKAIIVFREPVSRIVSHYYYVLENENVKAHIELVNKNIKLGDYPTSEINSGLRNFYTRRFSRLSFEEMEQNQEFAIEKAFNFITSNYILVGFQDNLVDFVEKIRELTNLDKPFINRRINKTKNKVSFSQIPEETKQKIAESNVLDIKLYDLLKLHYSKSD